MLKNFLKYLQIVDIKEVSNTKNDSGFLEKTESVIASGLKSYIHKKSFEYQETEGGTMNKLYYNIRIETDTNIKNGYIIDDGQRKYKVLNGKKIETLWNLDAHYLENG